MLEALDLCTEHGGPLSKSNIQKITELTNEQIKAEVSFLKKTNMSNHEISTES